MKPNKNRIKSYYDEYGDHYHQERHQTYYYSFINEIETSLTANYAHNLDTLEIGCGTGIILSEIDKLSAQSIGLDLSSGMLKSALAQNLTVCQGDACQLPFNDAAFDLVYSFKALPHVPNLPDALSEIRRVLKPGGKAILEFYNPLSFKGITNTLLRSKAKVFTQFHTPKQVATLIQPHFSIVGVHGARIFTPVASLHKLRWCSQVFKRLETRFSDSFLARFAGYYIVVLDTHSPASQS